MKIELEDVIMIGVIIAIIYIRIKYGTEISIGPYDSIKALSGGG